MIVHGSGIVVRRSEECAQYYIAAAGCGTWVNGDARMAGDQHNGPERELTRGGEARRGVGRPAERVAEEWVEWVSVWEKRPLCLMHNARLALHR